VIDMARWDTNHYQRIAEAEPLPSHLRVVFEDGTAVEVKYAAVLPEAATRPEWTQVRVSPFEVTVPTLEGEVEIPWSTVRILTDPEYSAHLAEAAQEEARAVGQRIRCLRKARGLTGKELASRAGITPQSLSRIENGHHDVVYTTLCRILAAMNCSLSDLVDDRTQLASRPADFGTTALEAPPTHV
jgi:DNA-binding Xre family transcriptional regulator